MLSALRLAGRRPAAGLAALVLAVSVLAAVAQAQPAPVVGFDVQKATARAGGHRTIYEVKGFLPLNRLIEVAAPDTLAIWEPSRQFASASMPYPGDTVISVPGTAAGLSGTEDVPGYPLYVSAQHPFQQTAELGAEGTGLRAEANATRAAAAAATVDTVGPDAVFEVGTTRSWVESLQTDDITYGAVARSQLNDITIAGVIHIGSVLSEAEVRVVDGEIEVSTPEVQLEGVTVQDVPARIDEEGVRLGDSATGLAPVHAALDQALSQAGARVRLVDGTSQVRDGKATATGGSVVITIAGEFQGFPSELSYRLGDATVDVSAIGPRHDPSTLVPDDGLFEAPSGDGTGNAGSSPGLSSPVVGGTTFDSTEPVSGVAPGTDDGTGVPSAGFDADDGGLALSAFEPEPEVDFRPVYQWLAVLGVAAVAARGWLRSVIRQRRIRSDLKELWRW